MMRPNTDIAPADLQPLLMGPFYEVATRGRRTTRPITKEDMTRQFSREGVTFEFSCDPARGWPTIRDSEILVFAQMVLREFLQRGRVTTADLDTENFTIPVRPFDFFRHSKGSSRRLGMADYERLESGLDRLAGLRVKTNVRTGSGRSRKRTTSAFPLISYRYSVGESTIAERRYGNTIIEIKPSAWLTRALQAEQTAILSQAYFGARPLVQCLMRAAALGDAVSITDLVHYITWRDTRTKLRGQILKVVAQQPIPDIRIIYREDSDSLCFEPVPFALSLTD